MELNREKLLELYPQYTSVLGPYTRPDGRKHVVLNKNYLSNGQPGKLKTISYPKALVESNAGKRLLPNETVDHNDRDKTNDTLDNLVIRDRSEHCSLDANRVNIEPVSCPECSAVFTPSKSQINPGAIDGEVLQAGPFCSRRCSGIYGSRVQNGGERMQRQKINKTYYRVDK